MKVTLRAFLALSLLAGFYLLVGAIIAIALVIDIGLIVRGDGQGLQAGIVITLVAFALVRALIMVSRRQQAAQPGVEVTPEQEPELWRTVNELAEQVQTQAPDEIRIIPDVNAAVSEDTKFLGLKATRRRMYIGMPLLITMTVDEMRSILGHELGHYSGSHTRLGAPVYRGRISLIAAVQGLEKHPFVQKIFLGYAKFFLRVSQAVSRRQELEADEHSVRIAGRAAASSALRKVHGAAPVWGYFLEAYAGLVGPAQARPADLFGGFQALVSNPVRQREMAAMITEEREHSPYDSHPSLTDRLSAIEKLPDPAVHADQRPATELLRDPDLAARAVEESFWTPNTLALPTASWEDVVARGMYVAANREAARDFALAGQRLVGAPDTVVDAGFEALARGQVAELRAELVAAGWNDGERLLDAVITRTLEAALIDHGSAYWALSWSSAPRLIDTAGQEVKLAEFAAAVVADPPNQVPVLRDWLARSGISPDYCPELPTEQSPEAPLQSA
ncbi:M48 family metalloprotease [Phytoactinopolyspora alkaliphila]|uniref:M48 family metalloprotease n=1 Tax=Phytoactinopolyspora alkaliphila TaxID=1783498 RepID=A0A6N9YTG3_9ACTN|nr:M48 family metallopeptidase [Phytoactinopolyspora alkaliphila]NED98262.1 M48 family metalloprotease [Phytoactinopolyspora alkaliphila]